MSITGPNEHDNPSEDQELYRGDTVYFAQEHGEGQEPAVSYTPYTIQAIGSSKTDYDYIVRAPSGESHRVVCDEVQDINSRTCLVNVKILTKDTTELSLPEMYEDYELMGTEQAKQGQYIVIKWAENGTGMRKFPIAAWGQFMVKKYTDLNIVSTEIVLRPMVCLPKQLNPQRVTDEMFVDWAMV